MTFFITFPPGANAIKVFTAISYNILQYAGAFVPDKPYQPIIMFEGKDRSLP